MKNIIIRTLGGGEIGYGHFFRCLSLYKALCKVKATININFIINSELIKLAEREKLNYIISDNLKNDIKIIEILHIDLFILDTYLADNLYLKMIKNMTQLMLIDDNNDIYDSTIADIIYNGNIHAQTLKYPYKKNQLRLMGTEYLIMKEEYWDNTKNYEEKKSGILITTGGSDTYGISRKIMNNTKNLDQEIKIILGPGNSEQYNQILEQEKNENVKLIYSPLSLKSYINESSIVITAAGSTIYEVLSQNKTPIIFSLADNQDLICKEFISKGIKYIGKYPNINYLNLSKSLNKDSNVSKSFIKNIDGKGIFRTIQAIVKKIKI